MKVVIKRPNESLQVIEVEGLQEINQIVGNFDEHGNGLYDVNSDIRTRVFDGIDMYVNELAQFNPNLPKNFWDVLGFQLICGNAIFAGFDKNNKEDFGLCSLTDEQIDYLKNNVNKVYDI